MSTLRSGADSISFHRGEGTHEGSVQLLAERRESVSRDLDRLERELADFKGSELADLVPMTKRLLRRWRRERIATLDAIDRALERVARGEYGICSDCRRSIDPRRLQFIPETALCSTCSRCRELDLDKNSNMLLYGGHET